MTETNSEPFVWPPPRKRSRPRFFRRNSSVGLYTTSFHMILFKWGFTIRYRRRGSWPKRGGWRHIRASFFQRDIAFPRPTPKGVMRWELSTWRSGPGPNTRVLRTKQYFRFQIAMGERTEGEEEDDEV